MSILIEICKPFAIGLSGWLVGRGFHYDDPLLYVPASIVMMIVVSAVMIHNHANYMEARKGETA